MSKENYKWYRVVNKSTHAHYFCDNEEEFKDDFFSDLLQYDNEYFKDDKLEIAVFVDRVYDLLNSGEYYDDLHYFCYTYGKRN